MKNPALIVLIFLVIAISGTIWWLTNSHEEKKEEAATRYKVIRDLYNKLKVIDLPYEYSDSSGVGSYDYYTSGSDTLLFDNDIPLLGVLEDTGEYFAFIKINVGDYVFPELVTFNKKGKLISQQELALGYGDDCGYDFDDKNVLSGDFSISLYIKEEHRDCNDDGPYGPTTFIETTQTGSINKKGHIIMNKPVKKEWVVQDSTAMRAQPAVPEVKESAGTISPPKP